MKTSTRILMLAAAMAMPLSAGAGQSGPIVPPPVPERLALSPQEFTPFLVAHAVGTQGYVCVRAGAAYSWVPYGPQATLFNQAGAQLLTHFLSPRPYDQLLNPTWQHSRDSSAVWAKVLEASDDPDFVAPGAIPWLLLEATVVADGPTGGNRMVKTSRIQRVNTVEGQAPTTGCAARSDIGKRALVPYEADYFFYREKD